MLLSLLIVKYIVKDNIGHGVTRVLVAISKNESRIARHNIWSSLVTSALTIGFGGSVGAEAPIVYSGAAIGSNIGRHMGMSYRNITILLGCGAAGAVAGIFNAPLAGVLFTLEILLFNISMSSILPLLISTVSATIVSYLCLGQETQFACTLAAFKMGNVPFYLILGVICGFSSLYFMRMTLSLEDRLSKVKNPYLLWLLCAAALGALIFIFPPLYGEGYAFLGPLLNGQEVSYDKMTPLSFMLHFPWAVPIFFTLVLLMKVFAMTFTNAGGGVGGTFGPTLFVGAITGFVMASVTNLISPGTIPVANFVLVGMAGLMAGVMQAPMTAIFLIAEISGGYALDQAVLTLLKGSSLIEQDFTTVRIDAPLKELVEAFSSSSRNIFPVIDGKGRFQGFVSLGDIRKDMFDTSLYETKHVFNYVRSTPEYVYEDESMESVMRKFEKTGAWNLPVVTPDRKYLGFVSKSKIFNAYRDELRAFSQD